MQGGDMHIDIIKIGNSKGIRIPKSLLEQCGFDKEAELTIEENKIIISPVATARQHWESKFSAMAKQGDDKLEDDSLLDNHFDHQEWSWE
jgi:antitoxin MazE